MRRILITGKNGQIGWELQRTLATLGEVVAVGVNEMDLANPDSIRRVLRGLEPDVIVNAAAYTAVDKAESEPKLAMAINGVAPGIIAEEAKRLNAGVVHYSTDYVFDGTKQTPYTENDAPNPINVYGKTKLAGEQAVAAVDAPHLILRTSWVYGARGKNFLKTILRLAKERDELKIVNDQFGAPTWCRMIAEATGQIIAQLYSPIARHPPLLVEVSGVYNLTCAGGTTWHGFAKAALEYLVLRAQRSEGLHRSLPNLVPIPSEEYPSPAKRPRNSRLDNASVLDRFGIALPSWDAALSVCMDQFEWTLSSSAQFRGASALSAISEKR